MKTDTCTIPFSKNQKDNKLHSHESILNLTVSVFSCLWGGDLDAPLPISRNVGSIEINLTTDAKHSIMLTLVILVSIMTS